MCTSVFDRGGACVPLEHVSHTERTSDGRIKVFLKTSENITFIKAENAAEFVDALKAFHEKRNGDDT